VAWILVVAMTRFASLGSLVAAFLIPLAMLFFREPWVYVVFSWATFLLIVYKHRVNLDRLLKGKENKLSFGFSREEQV